MIRFLFPSYSASFGSQPGGIPVLFGVDKDIWNKTGRDVFLLSKAVLTVNAPRLKTKSSQ